jgi:hypothetical protein
VRLSARYSLRPQFRGSEQKYASPGRNRAAAMLFHVFSSLRAKRSNPFFLFQRHDGLLRRFAPRNDDTDV